jgi:hypothetical protein
LLATLKAQAAALRPDLWLGMITVCPGDSKERLLAYIEDVSLLSTQLVYFDLASIDPLLARLIVLSRLVADNAPISCLREELLLATADVIESRSNPDRRRPPVTLFTERMQVEPITAEDDTPTLSPAAFDLDKWSQALAQNLWGTA